MSSTMRCFWVEKSESGEIRAEVTEKPCSVLDQAKSDAPRVRIRVNLSSLNYKDALAATGHPGIVRHFPHIPGIDAVGAVVHSDSSDFSVGEEVLVTGNDLGVGHFGAWAEMIDVPAEWVLPLPKTLSPLEAMTLGTAGFTAAQCVQALIAHEITPDRGSIVVTGATGGVASVSIEILRKLGYSITAVTGKQEHHQALLDRGVDQVVTRSDFIDQTKRPLLGGKYAGGVDTVGGSMLETVLRSTAYRGCVTACGLTGGADLNITVHPFILRGITLCGIDSAMCPLPKRKVIWEKLAGEWKLAGLESLATQVPLEQTPAWVQRILAGGVSGRVVVGL
ncbi:YhdH/YhfP family quinone oxidoreductase [Novipirellula artificiosorum]|uniref:Acrylyl-CoA reductase AcuI n=1 Tax=Novipirellula artificiosorum TaxID=2528016 RepID=A0A5C6DH58_9BACT|nr:YhdH/YhfP family quinone oxidoreductase [Novipirellula artificiosorum]TWU34376.1 Acrylyl-CoA reductase AcuI [Novipirellula artificiosorum]